MSTPLRQNTAGQVVPFTLIDATDFKTPKSGLTIANTDIKLIPEGGTSQTAKHTGGATEIGSTGTYYCTFDATDTATLGRLHIDIQKAGALPYFKDTEVLGAAAWDALYAGANTDLGGLPKLLAVGVGTGGDIDTVTLYFNGPITVDGTKISGDSGFVVDGAIVATAIATVISGNIVKLTTPDGVDIGQTFQIVHQPAWITNAVANCGGITLSDADAQIAIAMAHTLASIKTDSSNLIARLGAWTGTGINNVLGAIRALFSKAAGLTPSDLNVGGATGDNTTDSLEALRDRGDVAWVSGVGGGGGAGEFPIDHNGGSGTAGAQCAFYLPYSNATGVHSSTDVMRLTSNGSIGMPSLSIRAYLASDYDAGSRAVLATTTTNSDGRWAGPINLDAGTYYLIADRPGDGYQAYQIKVVIP